MCTGAQTPGKISYDRQLCQHEIKTLYIVHQIRRTQRVQSRGVREVRPLLIPSIPKCPSVQKGTFSNTYSHPLHVADVVCLGLRPSSVSYEICYCSLVYCTYIGCNTRRRDRSSRCVGPYMTSLKMFTGLSTETRWSYLKELH